MWVTMSSKLRLYIFSFCQLAVNGWALSRSFVGGAGMEQMWHLAGLLSGEQVAVCDRSYVPSLARLCSVPALPERAAIFDALVTGMQ